MKNNKNKRQLTVLIIIAALISGTIFFMTSNNSQNPIGSILNPGSKKTTTDTDYTTFSNSLRDGKYSAVVAKQVGNGLMETKATLRSDENQVEKTFAPSSDEVIKQINENIAKNQNTATQTKFSFEKVEESFFSVNNLIGIFIPLLLVGMIFFSLMRTSRMGGAGRTGPFKPKYKTEVPTTRFKDVAGYKEEKQELEELIDFLKNSKKYADVGAKIPHGILLEGPPGTGKTLLAKAGAGESNVKFMSIAGSEFIEMYAGLGASRVRTLFEEARKTAPTIIFIDEIDAIGRQRGAGIGGGNDEREQTLNQILVEMDGIESRDSVIVIAATNRADVLDPALVRPGRFDRKMIINLPDKESRVEILKVHANNKKMAPNVNFENIAKTTQGFSGAELSNVLNEAAILSVREGKPMIDDALLDEAIDRVIMGPSKSNRTYTEKEKQMIAYHESGHALIGVIDSQASFVQKVTIIPRGMAGGYAMMTPNEEKFTSSKSDLLGRIVGYLGGRAAEEIVFNEVTTGASNDFQNATAIARSMVTEFGMSSLGPVQYEQNRGSVFLGRDYNKESNYSQTVAEEIDKEVKRIIEECYEKAKKILLENRDKLDALAKELFEKETLVADEIQAIVYSVDKKDEEIKENEINII
jgi:cell division protease FtsH